MSTMIRRWRDWLPLFVILSAGAFLRLYRVGELPPGLYRDEGFYALDALNVLRGHPAIFFAANNGREGLFIYLLAGGIALFGRTPEAVRVVSALIGTLTILAIYGVGRNLFSHRIGLLSAAVLSITFWHLALSRIAYRAIALPLLLCLTVALAAGVWRQLRMGRLGFEPQTRPIVAKAFLAGIAFGLTFYTYTSAQFLLLLVAVFVALYIGLHALRLPDFGLPSGRLAAAVFVVMAAGALLTLAPFAVWLTRHADMYLLRAGQVSILSPLINKGDVAGTLWSNMLKAAGMFVVQGDRIWRHNLSLRPVFDGPLGAAFLFGVIVCAWRMVRRRAPAPVGPQTTAIRPASLLVLLWLVIFLIPTILAEDTPHFVRAIGVLPAACLIAALGLEAGLAWLSRRGLLNLYFGRLRRSVSPPALVAAAVLVASGMSTVADYFDTYVRKDVTAYWLEDQNVQLAHVVNAFTRANPPKSVWLQDRLANDNPSLRFLSPDVEQERVTVVDAQAPTAPPTRTLLLVDPNHDWSVLRDALPVSGTLSVGLGPMAQGDLDLAPRRAFISIFDDPLPSEEPSAAAVTFEQGITIQRARVQWQVLDPPLTTNRPPIQINANDPVAAGTLPPATNYTVTVFWSATRPVTQDLAVFVHWMRNGSVIAQDDDSPGYGYLPMPVWRPGEVIADEHTLTVPGDVQAGDEVWVGVYRREGNVRLSVLSARGQATADAALIIRAVLH